MSETDAEHSRAEDLYRIGTVAQLTGLSVERLRAWERRYGLAPAHRAGKTRFYSASQLARLTRIKRLIDAGHPISSLAELSDEQLEERLANQLTVNSRPPKTGLIGPNLLVLEQQQSEDPRILISARWANMEAFRKDQLGVDELDAVVVQLPVLSITPLEIIEDLYPAARIVALYQFATENNLNAVSELGVPVLKWPAPWADIEAKVASVQTRDTAGNVIARRFSDEELVAIAASTLGDPTGCPQHLVELISQLNAFAEFCRDCATAAPDDRAALLAGIHGDATQSRAQLERALESLAMAEGLIASPAADSGRWLDPEQNLYKK